MDTLLQTLKTESPYLQLLYILLCFSLALFTAKKLKNLSFFYKLASDSRIKALFVRTNNFLICFSLALIYGFLIHRRYFGYGGCLTLTLFLLITLIPVYLLLFLFFVENSADKKGRRLLLILTGAAVALYPTGLFHYFKDSIEDYTLFFLGTSCSLMRFLKGAYSLVFFTYVTRYISLRCKAHLHMLYTMKATTQLLNYRIAMAGIYSLGTFIWMKIIGTPTPFLKWVIGILLSIVSFSMRRIIWEFISGILILKRGLIYKGEWVAFSMGTKAGIVKKLCLTYVLVEEENGNELFIPNSELITSNFERHKLVEN